MRINNEIVCADVLHKVDELTYVLNTTLFGSTNPTLEMDITDAKIEFLLKDTLSAEIVCRVEDAAFATKPPNHTNRPVAVSSVSTVDTSRPSAHS